MSQRSRPCRPVVEGAEIDWITAAASAGIQAAEDADEDGFEAHQPVTRDADDGDDAGASGPMEAEEIVASSWTGLSRAPAMGPPAVTTRVRRTPDADADAGGRCEPTPSRCSATPCAGREPRRRGRRSAGRPAGAPPAAQPVDMVIRDAVPEPQQTWTAPVSGAGFRRARDQRPRRRSRVDRATNGSPRRRSAPPAAACGTAAPTPRGVAAGRPGGRRVGAGTGRHLDPPPPRATGELTGRCALGLPRQYQAAYCRRSARCCAAGFAVPWFACPVLADRTPCCSRGLLFRGVRRGRHRH